MAELEEEIIIIEDSDAAEEADLSYEGFDEDSDSNDSAKKKKIIIIAGATVGLILIISIILFFVFSSSDGEIQENYSMDGIEEKLEQKHNEGIEPSKLENMIAKANYLYSNGSKNEALAIYEQIAHYSEAISAYNLGVAQLKDNQYELALETFKKAIMNDEKRCVSAINAAVCSLHINDKENFQYYIDLAYAYLPQERSSQLYSYYYALINYYNNNYLEVLSALQNPSTQEYKKIQNDLSAKINALFENDYDAIEAIEDTLKYDDDFALGLLYARVGDISLAKKYLESAIEKNIEPIKAQLALAYINLKAGQVSNGAKLIENITDMYAEEVYKPYPIKVHLKKSLFDTTSAQTRYRSLSTTSRLINYQKIFYFSPYKVFNANKTISYIRKGNANIFIDDVSSAKEYLSKSSSSSNVNVGIVKAIKKALSFRTREANNILQKLVKIQPKHSILHYNLGLTYAQMGNMQKAYFHFLRSYHLDAKNYLSGIYAMMSGQLIDKENKKLSSILADSVSDEDTTEDITLYKTLLHIAQNNVLSTVDWLDYNYKQRPLYLALDIIIALELKKTNIAKQSAAKLVMMQDGDILPHLMYIDANFDNLSEKEYAKKVQNYLKVQKFNFDDLYFGPYITRYLYIQQNLIIGKLYFVRQQIKEVLQTTRENTQELTSALALASLYDGAFEEAYTLYNNLIDNLKLRDSYTLFLGAIASIAADHHANAIALLELSKLKNKSFSESRYGLGLLYLEVKNNKGAVVQLSKINKNNFNSEYFNFNINLDELLFKKQHPNADK